jgi:hypothetical protein
LDPLFYVRQLRFEVLSCARDFIVWNLELKHELRSFDFSARRIQIKRAWPAFPNLRIASKRYHVPHSLARHVARSATIEDHSHRIVTDVNFVSSCSTAIPSSRSSSGATRYSFSNPRIADSPVWPATLEAGKDDTALRARCACCSSVPRRSYFVKSKSLPCLFLNMWKQWGSNQSLRFFARTRED